MNTYLITSQGDFVRLVEASAMRSNGNAIEFLNEEGVVILITPNVAPAVELETFRASEALTELHFPQQYVDANAASPAPDPISGE